VPTDLPPTFVPLELRVKMWLMLHPVIAFIRFIAWLRFLSIVLDLGWANALIDRHLWVLVNIEAMLREFERTGIEVGYYSARVLRAAILPYRPKGLP
jgi:hypothetical protein